MLLSKQPAGTKGVDGSTSSRVSRQFYFILVWVLYAHGAMGILGDFVVLIFVAYDAPHELAVPLGNVWKGGLHSIILRLYRRLPLEHQPHLFSHLHSLLRPLLYLYGLFAFLFGRFVGPAPLGKAR